MKDYFRLLAEDREKGFLSRLFYPLLTVVSRIFGSLSVLNRRLYEKGVFKRKKLPFPVISVGNLTWGGSGKTPLVEFIARRICEFRKNPLILTRGYSHDEVHQYQSKLPKVQIGVGRNRYREGMRIGSKSRVDAAVLDDGMQHWPLQRDLEIVTVNALNPFGNNHLVPRGPLREPVTALERADFIVIHHVNLIKGGELQSLKARLRKLAPRAALVDTYLEPLFFYRARKRQRVALGRLQHQKVTTFSAVGVPRSFQLILVQSHIKPVRNFEFTDHHMFSRGDLHEIRKVSDAAASAEIITTEKDYFRAPDVIADVLNPLVLATKLRVVAGEDKLNRRMLSLLGVRR